VRESLFAALARLSLLLFVSHAALAGWLPGLLRALPGGSTLPRLAAALHAAVPHCIGRSKACLGGSLLPVVSTLT